MSASDWERLGGEPVARAIVHAFMERVFADAMIGFFFDGKPKARIEALELELVSELLGGPYAYSGRPMAEAHRRSPIMGGHFARRRKILIDTLARYGVPPDIQARWLAHIDALRPQVLGRASQSADCDDTLVDVPPDKEKRR